MLLLVCLQATAQPIDVRVARDAEVEDYDFSWVYWFETHGRAYLRESLGERQLPMDIPATRLWRGAAMGVLEEVLGDGDDRVRAAAVLALARAGHEPLLDRLLPEVDEAKPEETPRSLLLDVSSEVRLSAWAALGLMDTPRTRAALAAEPLEDSEESDLAAQAMAVGLLDGMDRVHLRWLIARLDDPEVSLEVKRWCLRSLRRQDDPALDPVYEAALNNLPSTFAIGEALLHRGFVERRGGAGWLIGVLRYDPDVRRWAGYRALAGLPAEGLFGSSPRRLAMETRVAGSLTLAQLPLIDREEDKQKLLSILRRRMVAGNSAQAMDFNRGFDTLAYYMHCNLEQADLDLLYDQMRGFTQLPPDDPAVLEELGEGAVPRPADLLKRQSGNAVRGYAALAAGLLIRRATQETELSTERPVVDKKPIDIERLKRRFGFRLMRAVADEREPVDYRAACALALGLSGDSRYAAELAGELAGLRGGDEVVLGYGLLALAMLGEDRAAEPARRYVTRPGKVSGAGDLLGRRAALRAIAIIGTRGGEDTKQALTDAWGKNTWVSLCVAEATAWSGSYSALPKMLEALGSESPAWRLAAAHSLGTVFDRSFPIRVGRLIEQNNPTTSFRPIEAEGAAGLGEEAAAPDPSGWPMRPMHALGDPFVYEFLFGLE